MAGSTMDYIVQAVALKYIIGRLQYYLYQRERS